MTRTPSLLFVNQHYYPDVASTGQHLTDLAEYLAASGYTVDVVTAASGYVAGQVAAPRDEWRNGVHITRVRGTSFGRGTHVGRLLDYLSFVVRAALRLMRSRRYDGVVFLTTPPLLSLLGRIALAVRGQRYGIWSMDLHPDAEVASGMLRRQRPPARLLEWLNRLAYRGADFVVDLGPYMKVRVLAKGVAPDRVRTVSVWNARDEIRPIAHDANPVRQRLGITNEFVVMYSGNAGLVHEFDVMLEAMRRLRNDPGLLFLFVGGGPRRAMIEEYVRAHAIRNFRYLDYVSRDQLSESLSAGDAHLISLGRRFVGISVPGKLYGIMAAGRPALFVGPERSETADTIEDARCGLVFDPASNDAADRLVNTLRSWSAHPARARVLGARARTAFLQQFERDQCCARFERVIRDAWGGELAVSPEAVRWTPAAPPVTATG